MAGTGGGAPVAHCGSIAHPDRKWKYFPSFITTQQHTQPQPGICISNRSAAGYYCEHKSWEHAKLQLGVNNINRKQEIDMFGFTEIDKWS